MKKPGKMAYEAWMKAYGGESLPWEDLGDDERDEWAAVESAIRADEAAKVRAENERLREAATALFDLIDEIDTISDLAKNDDKLYRQLVERTQRRRFEIATTDGYSLTFRSLNRAALEEKK
jgi:hypothetical protein